MPKILCKDVSVGYGSKAVCRGLNFKIEQGDYLCIVGPNGAGKSTLMKTLLGLIPAIEGDIKIDGGGCVGNIGYLPQQSEHQQDFPATVGEVILSGCIGSLGRRFFYNRSARLTARLCARQLGVDSLWGESFGSLSGGQKRRVLLARALCCAQKILLLDEPAASLDPQATSDMYDIIQHLRQEHGITVIMITHDIPATLKYATCVLRMQDTPVFFDNIEDFHATLPKCREGHTI